MSAWAPGGGFALAAAVRSAGADRAGLERLLRYCARPPFALAHRQQHDAAHLRYHIAKPHPGGPSALVLTPRERLDRIAALVPAAHAPPPLRRGAGRQRPLARRRHRLGARAGTGGHPAAAPAQAPHRTAARYRCAMLLARIYAVLVSA